ncbi:NAD(P)-dependent oxidoreductase [Sphingomonas sp. MMS24-JH45]
MALLRPHVFVINASRGGILDEDALVEALETGRLAGRASTCGGTSPRSCSAGAAQRRHSHGSATYEGAPRLGERVIQNIRMRGRPSPARSGARRLGLTP